MANKPLEKMTKEERAKQFMPFSALGGLDEALRQKEWEMEAREQSKHQVV